MKEETKLKNIMFFFLVLVIFNSVFCLSLDPGTIISGGGDNELIVDYSGDEELFFIGPDPHPPQTTIISPIATTYTSSSVSFEASTNENSTCSYTLDSGVTNYSMTANASGTGFTASRTLSNAVYTSQFYCWDVLNNLNNTESVTFTVSVSTPSTPATSTGGGGGGGSIIATTPEIKFSISPKSYEKTIVLNRIEFGQIEITNKENTKKDFNVKVEVLGDMISFDETSITLSSKEKKKLEFRIHAPKETGIYTGKIVVSSGYTRKEIFVVINVKTEKSLFDITLLIPRFMKTMTLGENLNAQVDLLQMGLREKIDVTLDYVIKDFSGKVHLTESETIAVYDQKSINKEFHTEVLESGDYVLGVELIYPDGVAVASSQFKIKEKVEIGTFQIIMISLILVLILVLVLIGFTIKRYKRIGKHLKK